MNPMYKYALAIIITFAIVGIDILTIHTATAQNSSNRLVIYSPSLIGSNPIELTKVMLKEREIKLGRLFAAGDNFIEDLSFIIKNGSEKRIAYVQLALTIPLKNNNKTQSNANRIKFPLHYGTNPKSQIMPDSFLVPGEFATVSIPESQVSILNKMLEKNSPDLSRVNIHIELVAFDDNTTWRLGYMHRQDPNNPKKWDKIDEGLDNKTGQTHVQFKTPSYVFSKSFMTNKNLIKTKKIDECYFRYDGDELTFCNAAPQGYWCVQELPVLTFTSDPHAGANYEGYLYVSCYAWLDPQAICEEETIKSRYSFCL